MESELRRLKNLINDTEKLIDDYSKDVDNPFECQNNLTNAIQGLKKQHDIVLSKKSLLPPSERSVLTNESRRIRNIDCEADAVFERLRSQIRTAPTSPANEYYVDPSVAQMTRSINELSEQAGVSYEYIQEQTHTMRRLQDSITKLGVTLGISRTTLKKLDKSENMQYVLITIVFIVALLFMFFIKFFVKK